MTQYGQYLSEIIWHVFQKRKYVALTLRYMRPERIPLMRLIRRGKVYYFGKAKIERVGKHVTIVSYGKAVETALAGAEELAGAGIEAEVINLRSLRPLDTQTIFQSIAKTHHLITVEQGWPSSGIGAEVVARVVENEIFFQLDAPVWRVTGADLPMPYTKSLEPLCLPSPANIVKAVKTILNVK